MFLLMLASIIKVQEFQFGYVRVFNFLLKLSVLSFISLNALSIAILNVSILQLHYLDLP
jgi:hypothetical protein